jgi:SAM-dependent methyltransferase
MRDGNTSSADLILPRSDEPPDFRRQAPSYARFRRDYSASLYESIAARTGPPDGRRALDLGCGTGFVSARLRGVGWDVVGADFSAPMLSEARQLLGGDTALIRARAEALPLAAGSVALVTCGTAFHWFAPRPALDEITRALVPGGWVALFWRYPARDAATPRLVREVLERFGPRLPDVHIVVHAPEPFLGSILEPAPPRIIPTVLRYTAADYHGYAASTELLRRFAGEHHAAFLSELREELERRFPDGIEEPSEEHLFLARRP